MTRAADDFDHLAGAYLSGASRGAPRAAAVRVPTILVVGNVPTLAGIWIAHYVDQRARNEGPVALVRLDGAASRGELFRAQGRALPSDATAWMDRVSAVTRTWVLCVDSHASAPSVVASGCPVVLLSGVDEAALAAARRTLEGIDEAARASGMAHSTVGLALVGAAPEIAREAAEKLVSWSRERGSSIKVALVMNTQRVDRVESTAPIPLPAFSGLDAASAAELIELAVGSSVSRFDAHHASAAAPATAPPRAAPVPAPPSAPASPAAGALGLFPEFTAIPFECPDAPEVLLGADANGGLHLIARVQQATALRTARAWANGNWRLLCAANNALTKGDPLIVEHILLEDAREAVALHKSGVLLHAIVTVPGAARMRVDLNDERSAGIA